jgi:hypothetical protein
VLKQVAALRRRDIEAKAIQYGLDMGKESDRLIAAEEVLSELAQTNPKSGLVQRAIAAIRKWIREYVPGMENMQLSDSEIIERYLVPAREFVQQGGTAAPGALAGAFSRRKDTRTFRANRLLASLAQGMRTLPDHDTAEAEAKKMAGPLLTNISTGMKASVSKKSAKKMVDSSSIGKSASLSAHYAAVGNVDKLFEVAIRTEHRAGRKDEDAANIKAIHKFDAPMPFNGEIWRVRMTVKEFVRPEINGDRLYTLEIADIEEAPVSYGLPSRQVSHAHDESAHWRTARFAQMVQIVKSGLSPDGATPIFSRSADQTATPEFKRWFGNSKVVDKDGKPLVVYHGTNSAFTAFDLTLAGSNNDPGMWGRGFYFSDREQMSKGYGDTLMPVYLSLQNPFIVAHASSFHRS